MDIKEISIGWILENYLPKFTNEEKDTIVAEVMRSKIISDAFNTPGGKQILMGVVNSINRNVTGIIVDCTEPVVDMDKVVKKATEIQILHRMLLEWASIYAPGERHVQEAKKLKIRKSAG